MRTLLYEFSFRCNVFGMGYIFFSLSLSLFFDTPCGCVAYLLWVCIFSLSFFLTCRSMWHTFFGYASFIFFLHSLISLIYFLKRDFVSSSGDLSDRSNVFHSSPRPFYVPFFHPTSNGSFWWICRYVGCIGNLLSYFAKSKTGSKGETRHRP